MWNWQQPDWPNFKWDSNRLILAEREYLLGSGVLLGTVKHLDRDGQNYVAIKVMCNEAITTSEIEGEILDRASVQSSIQRQLGLAAIDRRVRPKERGIAEMMVNLHGTFAAPLTEDLLFTWHRMIMVGSNIDGVGDYRTGDEAMQVVSGSLIKPRVHFEAPPSRQVKYEMARFIDWFNRVGVDGSSPLPALTRAGIAHLYFESIHPFEDGNGRIGRALADKALAQALGHASITSLATTILRYRKDYYAALEAASRQNEITKWLAWFGGVAIESGRRTTALTEFLIEKTKLLDRLRGQLNDRQEKALLRVMEEGPAGFKGGLSAGKYVAITGASPATATRDLADLVAKEALARTGELKHARYHLTIQPRALRRVIVTEQGTVVEV